MQSGFRQIPQRYAIRVRVAAEPDVVRRAVRQWGDVTPLDDGAGCLLEMSVDDLQWPVMVLAQVGAPFEIETPDELRAEVARVAAQFAPRPST